MPGKFQWLRFSDCDVNDCFFDSLKADYPEFCRWYERKSSSGEKALIYSDDNGVNAFLYLKNEEEEIILADRILPMKTRIKIGTLKLSDNIQGQRLGEGAIGVALWRWQESKVDEIYVTVFKKHVSLVDLLERFGLICVGTNLRGECVYLKDKKNMDYSNPYKSFPFLNPNISKAGYIPIYDNYHDTLFPYSELWNTQQEGEETAAANGVTKVFIGAPFSSMHYCAGDPVLIYRIYQGAGKKTYKSVVTSYCTITNVIVVKSAGRVHINFDEFANLAGNKTVLNSAEQKDLFNSKSNVVLLEMVYNGYFGKGHNVTHHDLKSQGFFEEHPYQIVLKKEEFLSILEMGDVDVQNVIVG